MTNMKSGTGLQTIFSFFLGLMVTAFIGVGVYTFHPSPDTEFRPQIQELNREEQAVRNRAAPDQLSPADRAQIQDLTDQRNSLVDQSAALLESWGRTTSIILIIFATLTMAVSLVRAARLPVISNGLLLGGVFTMVYGVGWIIATDTSLVRFWVLTAALAITLALGYIRFVRGYTPSSRPGTAGPAPAEVAEHLADLEARLSAAARALANTGPASRS